MCLVESIAKEKKKKMNLATQDAIETLRQLQKLSKELQPVKTALAALLQREQANPNPLAAAESLENILSRVVSVSQKYSSFLNRACFLLECELPRLQRVTPLLAMGDESTKSPASDAHAKKDAVAHDPFRYVCSPTVPHVLKPENYDIVRRMLCLRIEMVDYLIVTERYQLALHVLDAYGLPLFWFPKLLPFALPPLPPIQSSGSKATNSGAVSNTADSEGMKFESLSSSFLGSLCLPSSHVEEQRTVVAPEHIAIHCIEARHSVTEAIAYCEERLQPALLHLDTVRRPKISERVDDLLADLHATRLLQMYMDGKTDEKNVIKYISAHLLPYATRRPDFVQPIIDLVTLQHDLYTANSSTEASVTDREDPFLAMTKTNKAKVVTAEKREKSLRLVACMMSMEGYHKLAVSFYQVAVLLESQVLSALKASGGRQKRNTEDEGNMVQPSHILPDLLVRVVVTSILLKDEYFDRMVLQRSADVFSTPLSTLETHLDTQSGSVAFDQSIMSVVEEMFSCLSSEAPHHKSSTVAPLTAAKLLEVEDRWNNDVLFIKRPTRFYCHFTRKCFDGGTDTNCPMALPNGTVVSRLALMHSGTRKAGEVERRQNSVVCPRTKESFPFSLLRRIYVT